MRSIVVTANMPKMIGNIWDMCRVTRKDAKLSRYNVTRWLSCYNATRGLCAASWWQPACQKMTGDIWDLCRVIRKDAKLSCYNVKRWLCAASLTVNVMSKNCHLSRVWDKIIRRLKKYILADSASTPHCVHFVIYDVNLWTLSPKP